RIWARYRLRLLEPPSPTRGEGFGRATAFGYLSHPLPQGEKEGSADQHPRRRARLIGDLGARQHPRYLFLTRAFFQHLDGGPRMTLHIRLADLPMRMTARRDLRAVGHDQHLRAARQALQAPANGLGHGAADALIYLVEDHDRLALVLAAGQRRLHRQSKARQLSARGHRIQRAEGGPRVGRHLEAHRLDAQWATTTLDRFERHAEAGAFQL